MNENWRELDHEWQNFSQAHKVRLIEEGLVTTPESPSYPKKKVVIVGAGMAGLVAAFELKRTNRFDVKVIESRQNVGGRIRTIREPYFTEGLYGEAGAMRIPKDHELTLAYIDRAHKDERERLTPIELYEFRNDDDNAWCHFNGKQMRWRDYKRDAEQGGDYFNFGLSKDPNDRKVKKTIGQRFKDEVIEPLRTDLYEIMKPGKKNRDQALNELMQKELPSHGESKSSTLREFSTHRYLQEIHGWTPEAISAFGILENQQARLNNGVVALLREYLAGSFSHSEYPNSTDADSKNKYDLYQIDGGMDLLPRSFLKYLEDDIIFGAKVDGLEKEREATRVHYATIGGRHSVDGEYAIITLPFPMLRHIDFSSEVDNWDPQKASAIQGLNYSESGKILFQCKNRFWETEYGDYPIEGGRSQTDLAIRSIYYPTKPDDERLLEKRTKKAILLASYTWGRDSQRWTYLSHQERIQYAFKALQVIHKKAFENTPNLIEGAYSIMWQDEEFSGGAFALTDPYQEEYDEACRSADGRFHFAGEHTSLNYHRWIEGAVESGLRTAWEIYKTASERPMKANRPPARA